MFFATFWTQKTSKICTFSRLVWGVKKVAKWSENFQNCEKCLISPYVLVGSDTSWFRPVCDQLEAFWFWKPLFLQKSEPKFSEIRSKSGENSSIFDLAGALKAAKMIEILKKYQEPIFLTQWHNSTSWEG